MKVLKLSEENLSFLDIFSYEVCEESTNKYLKYRNPHILLIIQCTVFVASVGFVLRPTIDLSDWLMAMVQAITTASVAGAFICLALQMENIKRLHDLLQDIVDDGKFAEKFIDIPNRLKEEFGSVENLKCRYFT